MTRKSGWLLALVMLAGCQSTPPRSTPDPKTTAETTADTTTKSTNEPTAEPTAEPTVGDDLDRLLEALPADDQLHGHKGAGYCLIEGTECEWPSTQGSYTAETTEPGVPLRVTVATFGGGVPASSAVDAIIGECPDGPYLIYPNEPRGMMLGGSFPQEGEQTGTELAYGDFTGLACDGSYTFVVPPDAPPQNKKEFGGQRQSHEAVLSNDFYAVGFAAPDAELLMTMVAEYFDRAGLTRVK